MGRRAQDAPLHVAMVDAWPSLPGARRCTHTTAPDYSALLQSGVLPRGGGGR
jgi:hypothetical protein